MITVRAPHDQSVIGHVEADTPHTINAKVEAAAAAMRAWATSSPMYRAEVLIRIAEATRHEADSLARSLSLEQGKTLKEAGLEIERYVGPFIQYAGMVTGIGGRRVSLGARVEGFVAREPVGVAAAIIPWNFPASLLGSKLAPALAAGCGFLVKPAESTSLITALLVELAGRHLPEGLVDVVNGGAAQGEQLARHPDVARVAFTGSTAVGKLIAAAAAPAMKRLTLELGGCDPFVVLDDADLDGATNALIGTRFFNAGQVCVAPKRLVVLRAAADGIIERLEARLQKVTVGPGLDPASRMGPLHTEVGRTRLEEQIADAVDRGATAIEGGRPTTPQTERGWFIRPSLLLDPPAGARVRTEETFGPVLSVIRVENDDEAVTVANETSFGLGASVWSGERSRAFSLARRIPSGYTWINSLGRVYDELPFGGVKESGFGREHGVEALASYLEDHTYIVGL